MNMPYLESCNHTFVPIPFLAIPHPSHSQSILQTTAEMLFLQSAVGQVILTVQMPQSLRTDYRVKRTRFPRSWPTRPTEFIFHLQFKP